MSIRERIVEEMRVRAARRGLALINDISNSFFLNRERFDALGGSATLRPRRVGIPRKAIALYYLYVKLPHER